MMDFTKASFCVLLVLLTTAVSLKDTEDKQEDFLSQLLDPASGLLDEDTESSSCINEISSEAQSLARENIQKLINDCHPQLKQLFLHCLRKNNHPLRVFRDEDDSNVWHATYIKSLFARSNVPRRNLGRRLPERKLKVTNTVPAVKSSLLPASSPKKDTKSQSPTTKKASSNAKGSAKKKKDDKKTLVIVIAAVVTFVVALLLSICCCCCCRCCRKSRAKKNDERPLLSMSDYSVGSSNSARGNSTRGEKFNNLADHKNISSLNGNFSVGSDVPESQSPGAAARSSFDLKPPPGRVATIAAQLSPLKPPPGRPNVLPPQPHSGNAAAAPPPPPPPAPPQPGKPHTGPPPPPPPAPPGAKAGARAPPPPKGGLAPPRPPPPIGAKVARPLAISKLKAPEGDADSEGDADAPKAKLKPFFWDKVQANSDQSMVWNQIKSGSFQFDEEMMETLFGYSSVDKTKVEHKKKSSSLDPAPQYIQIIEAKKSQNLSILLKALNVTMEEVCDALHEGNELPSEFIQTLLKMAPTPDEELKLRLFNGKLSQLGPADRFLKALVEIPIAFKRLEALLFMGTLKEELTSTKESFAILEVASKELRSSRLFLKLLEAVLKTGNRMNDGTFRGGAHAFKLDTLLKLSDVKGIDGKTTLLHFVVKEIIRSEGIRAARISKESRSFSSIMTDDLLEDISIETEERYHELGLQVVSHLSSELENVKKAAALDADSLTGTTAKLGHGLMKTRDLLKRDLESQEADRGFYHTVESFVQNAEDDVTNLLEEEKKIMDLVKSTGDYFHGNTGRDEGLRLFIIVRDFLIMLDKVCKEVGDAQKKAARTPKQETAPRSSISDLRPPPSPDHRKQLFPAIIERRTDDFSSDDESP